MLTHPTLDQMHQLGLAGMARAFAELEANPQSAELSHAEWLGLLLDREATERYERRLRARLRYARLRHQAAVEDVKTKLGAYWVVPYTTVDKGARRIDIHFEIEWRWPWDALRFWLSHSR